MAQPAANDPIFDIMWNCRAMRRLKTDPVPESVLVELVDAAIHGPSGSNAQNWSFVIVRDAGVKKKVQDLWKATWDFYSDTIRVAPTRAGEDREARDRLSKAVDYMVDHLHEAPAIIFVGVRRDDAMNKALASPAALRSMVKNFGVMGSLKFLFSAPKAGAQGEGATAYPAVQNLLLAARALGLGAVLTTPHLFVPGEFEKILGMPSEFSLYAVVPVGYPKGKFGPVSRPDPGSVIHWDRYGN